MDAREPRPLPTPPSGRADVVQWVREHLGHVLVDEAAASDIRGGQQAADRALAAFDVRGYATGRNEVWPVERRYASQLSPYIRHGLLGLREVWDAVAGGPAADVAKFRDELLWQEYARHVYARLGTATQRSLRFLVDERGASGNPWQEPGRCLELAWAELRERGWLTNQQRMWLASHWSVRRGHGWRNGEDLMFRHLLDGSRAANRVGWQWTVGALTGRPYGFSREQVERRAPGLCAGCALAQACPIEQWPATVEPDRRLTPDPRLRRLPSDGSAQVPVEIQVEPHVLGRPAAVWITAESLGDGDPALEAHPDLPVVFVFDVPLLQRLRLSSRRLVFLAESLADLAERRELEVRRGDPVEVLRGRPLAATAAPVPGWRLRAERLDVVARHPWRWLVPPGRGALGSFSAWRQGR